MDPIGTLGEITIRTAYVIFSSSVIIQTYIDCGSWIRTLYIKKQLPQSWELRYMAFCLLVAVICLIGISYLYWMLLGAWRASRRSINQPWSALHIIQSTHLGSSAKRFETSQSEPALPSEHSGGLGVGGYNDHSQGLGPSEMVNALPQGVKAPEVGSQYGNKLGLPRPNNYDGYRRAHGFTPALQRGVKGQPNDAPQPNGIRVPRPQTRPSPFQDRGEIQEAHHFATSLPQNFGDRLSSASLWRSYIEDLDADGDVNMLGKRQRFH